MIHYISIDENLTAGSSERGEESELDRSHHRDRQHNQSGHNGVNYTQVRDGVSDNIYTAPDERYLANSGHIYHESAWPFGCIQTKKRNQCFCPACTPHPTASYYQKLLNQRIERPALCNLDNVPGFADKGPHFVRDDKIFSDTMRLFPRVSIGLRYDSTTHLGQHNSE